MATPDRPIGIADGGLSAELLSATSMAVRAIIADQARLIAPISKLRPTAHCTVPFMPSQRIIQKPQVNAPNAAPMVFTP